MKKISGIILAGLVLAASAYGYRQLRPESADGYQAAFLSNGQVYFGKASSAGWNYLRLDDVYYLLALQATDSAQPQYNLRKLGGELHGPKDSLWVNRSHLLFLEDLKEDGRVVKAIRELEAKD